MYVSVSGNEKEREKSIENIYIFSIPSHMTECVFIDTHCNINPIIVLIVINNIKKKLRN